ncbi:hypothetical protein [Rhizorhabdus argentea]|uniref:hypothetical protein n=1 Tax=Rhizorhabdus argentea TaxID=1387174 RepID=UPI0030EF70BA
MHTEMLWRDDIAVLVDRRATIEAVMAQYLAGTHQGCATDEEKSAAHRLFEALLGGLKDGAGARRFDDLAVRRHASRFGDGLAPILRDVLGADVSDRFIMRCVDRYWAALQAAAA